MNRSSTVMTSIKNLELNSKKIKTPNIFISYRLGDYPHAGLKCLPWKEIDIDALLINAYDFISPRFQSLLNEKKGIGYLLEFHKPIMMDSGGFYFMGKHNLNINPIRILDIESKSKVDMGVILDHPLHPNVCNPIDRIKSTMKNTSIMFKMLQQKENITNFTLLPVIHGYNKSSIDYSIKRLKDIMRKYNGDSLNYVGIGGLSPLSQRSDIRLATIISYIRTKLPETYIHCFSLGSPLMMLIAFLYGADTVDTQGWIKNAIFRAINLPGIGTVKLRLRDKEKDRRIFNKNFRKLEKQLEYLEVNEGFKPLYPFADLVDAPKNNRIHERALHNIYVYVYEARKVRESIKRGYFNEFIQERLSNTKLKKFLSITS